MAQIQIIILSLIQGITEFLPVSSSGHLILFAKFGKFADQGVLMDVALHIGSIAAVIIYFAPLLWKMVCSLWKSKFLPHFQDDSNRLFYLLMAATIPALLFGGGLKIYGVEWLRNTKLIGWNILLYGILLGVIDKWALTVVKINNLHFKDALLIGFAQCLALLPGTSRSGVTITMARFLGMERREAATFSMLLAIPTILAAGIVSAYELWQNGDATLWVDAGAAVGYSFIFSLLAIFVMMQWLKKWSFMPFVIYRIALGTILLLDAYGIYDVRQTLNF